MADAASAMLLTGMQCAAAVIGHWHLVIGVWRVLDFLAQRIAISVLTLFLITIIVFTGVRMIPGDPARVLAGTDADQAGLEEIRDKYGLRDPLVVQYLRGVGLALRGDLGESIRTRQPVVGMVLTKLPITVELACVSLLVALAIAIPAGVVA